MSFTPRKAIFAAVALAHAGMDIGITWHSGADGAARTAEEVRGHGVRMHVETQEVVDFCAEHDIAADIEVIDINDVNDAFDKMVANASAMSSTTARATDVAMNTGTALLATGVRLHLLRGGHDLARLRALGKC